MARASSSSSRPTVAAAAAVVALLLCAQFASAQLLPTGLPAGPAAGESHYWVCFVFLRCL
jgi:hypothetical protein